MKDWVTKMVSEQVEIGARNPRVWFNKQIVQIKELFHVPNIIGPANETQQRQGGNPAIFPDFNSFVTAIYKESLDQKGKSKTLTEQFVQLNSKIIEVNKEIKKKMYEADYEKAEEKLARKFEEKLIEIKE